MLASTVSEKKVLTCPPMVLSGHLAVRLNAVLEAKSSQQALPTGYRPGRGEWRLLHALYG